MSLRLACRWSGCAEAAEGPYCLRCGTPLYGCPEDGDPPFVMVGDSWRWRLADRLRRVLRPLLRFLPHRCEVCGRRFWRPRCRGDDYRPPLCSQECFDRWIPF